MILGNAQILTCPHCGEKKEIISLISGNSFGQIVWSDNKSIKPMLPSASFVQQCPSCGKYYLMSQQKKHEYGTKTSFEKGTLSYAQLKEALLQMSSDDNLRDRDRLNILIMVIWAFNDEYTRCVNKDIPTEEHTYIVSLVDQLLSMDSVDDLLRAELLRETGRFEEAIEILETYPSDNEFLIGLKRRFRESAEVRDTMPFIISRGY